MAKPEWGEKHRCTSCGKPFYDMQRNPITCPSCGAEHVPEKLLKPSKAAPEEKKKVVKKEVSEEEDSDILLDDDEILAEDDVDLPDDDDDDSGIGVVVSVKDEEDT